MAIDRVLAARRGGVYNAAVANDSLYTGLVSFWNMNEATGATRLDSYGTNHLTDQNSSVGTAGKLNNAVQFTSASSQKLFKTGNNLNTRAAGFSVSCWFNMTGVTATVYPIHRWEHTTNQRSWLIGTDASSRIEFWVTADGAGVGGTSTATDPTARSASTWYFVVGKFEGLKSSVSVNGGAFTASVTTLGSVADTTSVFEAGAMLTTYYSCLVDCVGFWNKILNASEIARLYNNGNGKGFPF